MANAYSLINLASNTTEELLHLSEAREALSKSTMPTRIVLLGQHGNGELPPEDRMKLIMTIRKETINLTHVTATTSQQTPNNKDIHIYMGEANGPLNYDAQDLKQTIQTATGAHITTPSHGTQREERSIRSHTRHPPTQSQNISGTGPPSRNNPPRTNTRKRSHKRRNGNNTQPLLNNTLDRP